MSEVDHKSKLTVVETNGATFVRTRELITRAQVTWPEGAKCAVLSLDSEGLALSIQLSEQALEQLAATRREVLVRRQWERTLEATRTAAPPANAPVGVCG